MSTELNAIVNLLSTVQDTDLKEHIGAAVIYLKYERFRNARQELAGAIAKAPDNASLRRADELLGIYIANRPSRWQRFRGLFGRK